jgi:peptidyl-prolyl cis-trans isomerase B (cyclophilin B)
MQCISNIRVGYISIATAFMLAIAVSVFVSLAAQADDPGSDIIPPEVTLIPAKPPANAAGGAKGAGAFGASGVGAAGQVNTGAAAGGMSMPGTQQRDPVAVMTTSKGVIVMRLFARQAPRTVANFIDLVHRDFYNGLTFHRVEAGFLIQGGCPKGDGTGVFVDPNTNQPRCIPLETSHELSHNSAGVVGLARFGKDPNSGSCQFYITLAPQPNLDGKYAIFGGVIQGMDVVRSIAIGDKILSVQLQ